MAGFLRKLFGKASQTEAGPDPASSTSATARVREDERIEDLYEEFCQTFCHRPGVTFMDHLKDEGVTRLIDWLHWSTPDPFPKSFIRLAVASTRKGDKLWEKQGLSMYYEGGWDQEGRPSQESQDALSVLAQVLGKPIKLYYTEKPDSPVMVMEFKP